MKKKLTTVGNSLALIIDRPILDLLDIDAETELDIRTDGKGLNITPVRKSHKMRVAEATEKMIKTHEKTLRKLAE
ncbi:MAG: AbrB/MazE/SpoVT family DNA-binding domain-containing protein [bacterium]